MTAASSDLNGTTLNILTWLARNKKHQAQIRQVIKEESPSFDLDEVLDSNRMDAIQDELYRINVGSSYINPRIANSNFKLGDISINKGTYVVTPTSLKLKSNTVYENAAEFEIGRFMDQKVKNQHNKIDYIPFSVGKRGCPGVKISKIYQAALVFRLMNKFEFEQGGEKRLPKSFDLSYSVTECVVKMRPV